MTKASIFMVALAVILGLVLAAASMVLGIGGKFLFSDTSNQANEISRLAGSNAGSEQALAVEPMVRRRPPQGYAQVRPGDTFVRSKEVLGMQRTTPSNSNPLGENSVYCFHPAFTPHVAVASPFFNNGAVVVTVTKNDLGSTTSPAKHRLPMRQ